MVFRAGGGWWVFDFFSLPPTATTRCANLTPPPTHSNPHTHAPLPLQQRNCFQSAATGTVNGSVSLPGTDVILCTTPRGSAWVHPSVAASVVSSSPASEFPRASVALVCTIEITSAPKEALLLKAPFFWTVHEWQLDGTAPGLPSLPTASPEPRRLLTLPLSGSTHRPSGLSGFMNSFFDYIPDRLPPSIETANFRVSYELLVSFTSPRGWSDFLNLAWWAPACYRRNPLDAWGVPHVRVPVWLTDNPDVARAAAAAAQGAGAPKPLRDSLAVEVLQAPPATPAGGAQGAAVQVPPATTPVAGAQVAVVQAPPPATPAAGAQHTAVQVPPPTTPASGAQHTAVQAPPPTTPAAGAQVAVVQAPPPATPAAGAQHTAVQAPPPATPAAGAQGAAVQAPPPRDTCGRHAAHGRAGAPAPLCRRHPGARGPRAPRLICQHWRGARD